MADEVSIGVPASSETLRGFVDRRHPDYARLAPHWDFLEETYNGGRQWFKNNVFKYHKEGTKEFNKRVERAYRFNHTREVVDLVNKYIFKTDIVRNRQDAPDHVKRFWERTTKNNFGIDEFMKEVSKKASIFGRVWVVVDNTKIEDEVITVQDEKRLDARVYSYVVTPQHVLDLSYTRDGILNWILIQETYRDDEDPFKSTGLVHNRWRLWTRNEVVLFKEEPNQTTGRGGKSTQTKVVVEDEIQHGLGVVPVIPVDNVQNDDDYASPALINDIAYLDRAVANYLSNLDAIIQDQTFSQLTIPAQNLMPGTEEYEAALTMGTKRVFIYDGEGGGEPKYISPDPKQAQMVVQVVNKIISEIYHSVGMAGERTKEDNAMGIDNSSGVAKAYDFERMNSLLCAKAATLDKAENELIKLVLAWHTSAEAPEDDLVKYPDNFDVRSIYDEFDIANRLALLSAPDELRRHQLETLVDKIFPRLARDLKAKIRKEIQDWPEDVEEAPPLLRESQQGQNNQQKEEVKPS